MKIITLTLNPAFDTHCKIAEFRPCHENIADITSVDAGGKGVNISRALQANGVKNTAVALIGEENGAQFTAALKREGLSLLGVTLKGRIRENITLHSENALETRISFHGFTATDAALEQVGELIKDVDENTVITLTGSIPQGITTTEVKAFLQGFKRKGVKIVIDSRSFSLDDLIEFGPWLIKPNQDETESYTGKKVPEARSAATIARGLQEKGSENVLVSLGGDGAVLACNEGVFYAVCPKIEVRSTIGAGDSMIAGFIAATAAGLPIKERLRKAVAYGTAACLQEGTRPPLPADIEKIEKQVVVKEIEE